MNQLTVRDWERVEKGLSILRNDGYLEDRYWLAREAFRKLFGKVDRIKEATRSGQNPEDELTAQDWEHIEKGLEFLQHREHRKMGYGKRPEVFPRLFSKIAIARQGAQD